MAIRMREVSALAVAVAVCLFAATAYAQIDDKPLNENWAPTEWGPDDRVGATNRTTPEMVLKAIKLVQHAQVATLGQLYASDDP
ncbi:MAG: cyclase family protein, partial [Candidatus Tectomicrobia bacterium]|nr:cyclase family protein [Candidatus Tectomicrobia bacterium]